MGLFSNIFGKKHVDEEVFRVPDGELVYAVGDIHGRADLLEKLLKKIFADIEAQAINSKVSLVFLGDYIDRGFHSKEVIDILVRLQREMENVVCLAGNHEDMLLQFLDDPLSADIWLQVGGVAALASYGVYLPDAPETNDLVNASNQLGDVMPRGHVEFLRDLKEHYRIGDYYFVHAGVRPGVVLDAQLREDKLSIRQEFTEARCQYGVKIVHGHSVVRSAENLPNRIAIDTGAFATGMLTAGVFSKDEVRFLAT
ncbi:serine/threonine protein phosphatase [Kordiimonas sp. SCSIO 12603]|uniref:metallophosphoesterase n=1 Tax=Kordiimonas sp. SCSIO 12603 TaxID=2829596 RepID=UPI002107FFE8|nr:metallophosphoesterase [Kordiimonas sp. SCSIO 12603]UTW58700.1 serine/threonine protein phosphatase [Kordiimonas sp. SCSIO 12603]